MYYNSLSNIVVFSRRKNQHSEFVFQRKWEVNGVVSIKQLSYAIMKYKLPDNFTHAMQYFFKTFEFSSLTMKPKGYSRSLIDRKLYLFVIVFYLISNYFKSDIKIIYMYNAKNIYLLKYSTKCIYYILCKEIQIVSVHILDNRIDEIEYR